MEQLLALEMVRVTEAAAIASARFMGRGDRHEADRAATEAMRTDDGRARHARHDRHRRGRARRGADALHRRAGRPVGRRRPGLDRRGRHRGRPARGHQPRRDGPGERDHRPRRLREGRPASTPPTRTSRSCASGRSRPARSTSRSRRPRTSTGSPRRWAARVNDITVIILDRPRHDRADRARSARPAPGSS